MTPVRIAFVGKGGAGKSVIAGAFARLLARRGAPVLAVDSDPMPGLGFSLGVADVDAPLPDDALEEEPDPADERARPRLRCSPIESVEQYAAIAADGVRFLQFGKLRGNVRELGRSQQVFRLIIEGMITGGWNVVGDLPGGTRQPFFGWGDFADTIVVVTEPTAASLLTARRLANLAHSEAGPARVVAVANKVSDADDLRIVADRTGLPVVAGVPADLAVRHADRAGRPLLDLDAASPAALAIEGLLDRIAPTR